MAIKVKGLLQNSSTCGIHSFLEEAQNLTINDQEKHKVKQIFIWNPMTMGLIMSTLILIIIMEFLSVRHGHPTCRNIPQDKEQGEMVVFTG